MALRPPRVNMGLPEAGAFALSAKGTSASNNLALPAAVSVLLLPMPWKLPVVCPLLLPFVEMGIAVKLGLNMPIPFHI
jgi:hypothetical protein